ncbi:MAG TPA: thiopeptide-type bacteriocin biosynthesis protein [Polyangia bacterium]
MYRPLSRFLLRAPLLPVAVLPRAARALEAHPLGADAVALASPTLAQAKASPARRRAIERYARRAAFRATPSGLLAGVCVGALGPRTAIATGEPVPHLTASWARVDALAQALLHEPQIRDQVRLRRAPSVWTDGADVNWVGPGEPFDVPCTAEVRFGLAEVLAVTSDWAPWPEVVARARAGTVDGPDAWDADDLLRVYVHDGLLQTDLSPPLVGPPPARYLRDRLAALGREAEAAALDEAEAAFEAGELARGRAIWAALPGRAARDVTAVLTQRPRQPPRLERGAVARAARLVPLLCRLQEALAPPVAERFATRAWSDALDATTEIFGAGALALGSLAAGDYGVDADDADDDSAGADAAPPALLAHLCEAIMEAARANRREATLDPSALEAALADVAGTPLPPTAELFLVPGPRPAGAPAGTGWLLGLHAPAGASLGRFVHAVGAPLVDACAEIAEAELRLRPGEERVDVAFAPSAELADLGAHPPIRARTLALSRWSASGGDLATGDLELEADPSDPQGLTLRARGSADGIRTIVPSPFLRARSATAPPGAARLLVGWSLQRQHAPWAFTPGPLADLAFLPRIVLEGFVIAPASWRLPPALRQGSGSAGDGRALRKWRRAARVPRMVQVGEGDELLPVDLQAPGAAADLAAYDRVFEIWPPLESIVDRDGRRVEAVVAVVDEQPAPATPRARPGRVPPPREEPPLAGWRTFKLFGAAGRQDALLTRRVLPAVTGARAAGEISAWFFLRYLDGPGLRPHVRLRVSAGDRGPEAFERRLRQALTAARSAGELTSLETGDYFPERGRFSPADLAAVHALFQSDSEAVAGLLDDPELDRVAVLPHLFDALARGFGLDLPARHALGRERRRAAEAWTRLDAEARKESDAAFRHQARPLRAALGGTPPPLPHHEAQVADAARCLTRTDPAQLLPTLLHLSSVRLIGPDPDGERLGYTFWERTLEGLRKTR